MTKLNAIETIHKMIYDLYHTGTIFVPSTPVESNPMIATYLNAFLHQEDLSTVKSVHRVISSNMNKYLYIVLMKDIEIDDDSKVAHFHAKINDTDYDIISLHPSMFKYEKKENIAGVIDNIAYLIKLILQSGIYGVTLSDFNSFEVYYLTLLLIHDLYIKTKPDLADDIENVYINSLENMRNPKIRFLIKLYANVKDIFKIIDGYTDNEELLKFMFNGITYLNFVKNLNAGEYEEWEKIFHSHS